ncbi:hypothetical protein [Dokdonia sp. Hel_I_53]|uniref:hypothetical protein n=1 Tax=Dokdonia sp. Hel_I_53 TaxID=1566287 RepID=UPI00119999B7|nr:hypothetical protein [Dokdonia sp. Hel_I_53]TVZ50956.1 hypothetical protein OD90_0090 [Dokdonia sp. Hel_I_53]
MKFIKQSSLILFLFATIISTAQEETSTEKTIDQQFTDVVESSNNYQQFKVIEKTKMTQLQANTKERINSLQAEISDLKKQISEEQAASLKVQTDLEGTQQDLEATRGEKDSIKFFGNPMKKGAYQLMMWGIVALLLLGLLFFIYRFRSSNVLTKEAQHRLDETEAEFDEYRRKALEKEQKLGRQLQDERNKALKSPKN